MDKLPPIPPSAPSVLLALASGIVSTLAVIVIAAPVAPGSSASLSRLSDLAESSAGKSNLPRWQFRRKLMMSQNFRYVLNALLSLIAIGLSIRSTGLGPVAVATPIQVGSNLLSNMCLQWFLGMIRPTKDQFLGTMTLAAAVTILPDIGPEDVNRDGDVLELLLEPIAILYIVVSFALMLSSILALTKGWVKSNDQKLLSYAVVGGTATVLSTSLGKVVQMLLSRRSYALIHNLIVMAPLVLVYVALGVICLGVIARANATLQDPSTYVPIASGVQLVCTCFAGLFIWGDWPRLDYPLGYSMVYVLVVLGTYGVSSFDLMATYQMDIAEDQHIFLFKDPHLRNVQKEMEIPPRGDKVALEFYTLVHLWNKQSGDQERYGQIIQSLITKLVLRWRLRCEDVVELVVKLLKESNGLGPTPSPLFFEWVEEQMKPYLDSLDFPANEKAMPLLRKNPSTMPNLLQYDQRAQERLNAETYYSPRTPAGSPARTPKHSDDLDLLIREKLSMA